MSASEPAAPGGLGLPLAAKALRQIRSFLEKPSTFLGSIWRWMAAQMVNWVHVDPLHIQQRC